PFEQGDAGGGQREPLGEIGALESSRRRLAALAGLALEPAAHGRAPCAAPDPAAPALGHAESGRLTGAEPVGTRPSHRPAVRVARAGALPRRGTGALLAGSAAGALGIGRAGGGELPLRGRGRLRHETVVLAGAAGTKAEARAALGIADRA